MKKRIADGETLALGLSDHVDFTAKIERINTPSLTPYDAIRKVRNHVTFLDFTGNDGIFELCNAYRLDFIDIDIRSHVVLELNLKAWLGLDFSKDASGIKKMKSLFRDAVLFTLSILLREDNSEDFVKRQIMTANVLMKTFHWWYATTEEGKRKETERYAALLVEMLEQSHTKASEDFEDFDYFEPIASE